MANEPFYPTISSSMMVPFRAVMTLMEQDPRYLDRPECPYSNDVKDILRRYAQKGGVKADKVIEKTLQNHDDLDRELVEVFNELHSIQNSLGEMDPKDKVQWMKAVVSVLDKIITLRERNFDGKKLSEFQRVVLAFLEEIMEPSQRTEFVNRLGSYLKAP